MHRYRSKFNNFPQIRKHVESKQGDGNAAEQSKLQRMETKDEYDNKVLVYQVANSVTRRTESRDMTTEMITTELCWFVVIFLHWFVIIFLCKLLYENTFVIRFMKTKVSGHPFGHLVKTKASDSIVIYWEPNQIWGILTSIMWEIKSIEILFRHLWKINSFDWTLMKIVASCFFGFTEAIKAFDV